MENNRLLLATFALSYMQYHFLKLIYNLIYLNLNCRIYHSHLP